MEFSSGFVVPRGVPQPCNEYQPPDWERHKDTIARLYAQNELKTVKSIMLEQHNFKATENQWKKQLKKWRLDKKRVKGKEYEFIISKRKQLEVEQQGKTYKFILHGQPVDEGKIARWQERHAKDQSRLEDDLRSETSTPSSLGWRTASPLSELSSPVLQSRTNVFPFTSYPNANTLDPSRASYSPKCMDSCMSPVALRLQLKETPRMIQSPSPTQFDWWSAFVRYSASPPPSTPCTTGPWLIFEKYLEAHARPIDLYEDERLFETWLAQMQCGATCRICRDWGYELGIKACRPERILARLNEFMWKGLGQQRTIGNMTAGTARITHQRIKKSNAKRADWAIQSLITSLYLVRISRSKPEETLEMLDAFKTCFSSPEFEASPFWMQKVAEVVVIGYLIYLGRFADAEESLRTNLGSFYDKALSLYECFGQYEHITFPAMVELMTYGCVKASRDEDGLFWETLCAFGEDLQGVDGLVLDENGSLDMEAIWSRATFYLQVWQIQHIQRHSGRN